MPDFSTNQSQAQTGTVGAGRAPAGEGYPSPEGEGPHGKGSRAVPPADNMGVKNTLASETLPVLFRCDYLRVTAWIDPSEWEAVHAENIEPKLGSWVDLEHGGRFYHNVYEAQLGSRLYANPGGAGCDPRQITLELPGKACAFLGWEGIERIYLELKLHSERISVTRLDLAFDQAPFTVSEFWEAINESEIRTYARRDSFKYITMPNSKRENGEKGCGTVYVGTRDSFRFLRVYDQHGFTRCELELHDQKAAQVAVHLFETGCGDEYPLDVAANRAMGHLRDFIDVNTDWWKTFTAGIVRAYMKLTGKTAQEVSADAVGAWIFKQTAAAFSVVVDVYGKDIIGVLMQVGRKKRRDNKRYQVILGERI